MLEKLLFENGTDNDLYITVKTLKSEFSDFGSREISSVVFVCQLNDGASYVQ